MQYDRLKTRIFLVFITLSFLACVPQKRISYVQSDPDKSPAQMVYRGVQVDDAIRPGDEIFLKITSADEEAQNLNLDGQRGVNDPTFQSYTVDDDGTAKFPYIGKIRLTGLTLTQASDSIESALSQFLYMPNVYLRFVNTKLTVLGEVARPGVYMFNYKDVNVFEALGYAGDITQFGNRREVLIIREDGVRRRKIFVDLTDEKLLESEYFILKSGDVIFIEPLKRKIWGIDEVPYNLITTLITTSIFVYTFYINTLNTDNE
ncbi:MAG: polysaccharide biosynthesis/export family protein [Bacteroidota bacterium]